MSTMQIRTGQVIDLMRGAVINPDLVQNNFVREVPAGIFDGVNRVFTLSKRIDPTLLLAFFNGTRSYAVEQK